MKAASMAAENSESQRQKIEMAGNGESVIRKRLNGEIMAGIKRGAWRRVARNISNENAGAAWRKWHRRRSHLGG
jgi:hypothetical protein